MKEGQKIIKALHNLCSIIIKVYSIALQGPSNCIMYSKWLWSFTDSTIHATPYSVDNRR